MKLGRRGIACIITIAAAFVIILSCLLLEKERVEAGSYSHITSDSIAAKRDEIANATKEQNDIKNSISNMANIVADLQSKKTDLNNYIVSIDNTVSSIKEKISAYENLIVEKTAELERKVQELASAEEQEAEQYEIMKLRIQYLYECGEVNYLEALITSDSFSAMLNRAEYVEEIASYDNKMLHQYIRQREYISLCKESVEIEKTTLESSKEALEAEKKNLDDVRAQKAKDLTAYNHEISLTQDAIKELEADLKFQTDLIAGLEKEITEEQKAILAESGVNLGYDGSMFACPAPKYSVISSPFGWRKDPFTGNSAYHNGIDMAAAEGTPIVAAYSGIVGEASYNSSMGNYIYLEHGDGLRTIYLHASKLYVKKNDVVTKGEVIGAVGTTGRSTGPHLHFSVRLNGEYVNPLDYLN